MTLTQQNRQRLAAICEIRTDWQPALTADGIMKLSQEHPNDDLLVCALTIAAARNPAANGPAFMLGKPLDTTAPAPSKPAAPAPHTRYLPCKDCGYQGPPRNDGTCVGCWQNRHGAGDVRDGSYLRVGTSPPPADFRQRVAAAQLSGRTNVPNHNQPSTITIEAETT